MRGGGAGEFQGENRAYGALITYSLNAPGLPLPDDEKERAAQGGRAGRGAGQGSSRRRSGRRAPVKEDQPTKEEARASRRPPPRTEAAGEGRDKEPKAEIRITDASGKLIRKMEARRSSASTAPPGTSAAIPSASGEPTTGAGRSGEDSGPT